MSMHCHKVITLEIFAKLLTSDSSVVSTKNFILRTSCLAALGLCQQAKYCAVRKYFFIFHILSTTWPLSTSKILCSTENISRFFTFPKMLPLLYSYAFLLGIHFAFGQNLILSPILFAKCYLTETFLAVQDSFLQARYTAEQLIFYQLFHAYMEYIYMHSQT